MLLVRPGLLGAPKFLSEVLSLAGVDPRIVLRTALPEDAEVLAEIERASWPAELAAGLEEIASRIKVFPAGQWLAEVDGRPAAVAWAQRIRGELLEQPGLTYDKITGGGMLKCTHDPAGEVYQLIAVGVAPLGRGLKLGRTLVNQQVETGRALPGIKRIVGFTRPVGYHRHTNVPIEEYVELRTMNDRPVDPMLAFHLGGGARLVSIHPQYRPTDLEACGYGVLIEYPV